MSGAGNGCSEDDGVPVFPEFPAKEEQQGVEHSFMDVRRGVDVHSSSTLVMFWGSHPMLTQKLQTKGHPEMMWSAVSSLTPHSSQTGGVDDVLPSQVLPPVDTVLRE